MKNNLIDVRTLALAILCVGMATACNEKKVDPSSTAESQAQPAKPEQEKTGEQQTADSSTTDQTTTDQTTTDKKTTDQTTTDNQSSVANAPPTEPYSSPPPQASVAPSPEPSASPSPQASKSPSPEPSPSPSPQASASPTRASPPQPEPSPKTIESALTNDDGVSRSLLQLFSAKQSADEIETAKNKIVDDVFSNEDEMPGKVFELQVNVAKVEKEGLYSPELKNRVALLQTGIDDRARAESAIERSNDIAAKGVYFVGLGLVGGTLAGTGAYKAVPKLFEGETWSKGKLWASTKASNLYAKVPGRTQLGALTTSAKDGIVRVVGKPFRPVEGVVMDHLTKLGVPQLHRTSITVLEPVEASVLPSTVQFLPTKKASLKYAALSHWEGQELGVERVLVFKQRRLLRGYQHERIVATNRMPADVAGQIARQIERPVAESADQVHFLNTATGEVTPTRWKSEKFQKMIAATGAKIEPYFATFDVPRAIGTGVFTTGAMVLAYNHGYDKGENAREESDILNLEAMIPPKGATNSNEK